MRTMKPQILILCCALLAACGDSSAPNGTTAPNPPADGDAPVCMAGGDPIELHGSVTSADAKTYSVHPFRVVDGVGRIEMRYGWTEHQPSLSSVPAVGSFVATTLDLGLWDQHGYRDAKGFRGWSGSREGRIDHDQAPIFVQADSAERGYLPGKIEPGVWYADLGVGAVSPQGADWTLTIACKAGDGGTTPAADPVDKTHVANAAPGWYYGDMHMHAYHSNPNAPDWDEFVARSRDAKLDFLMVTEYVTTEHWRTLGAVQRANPDLIIWPGREIITYYGHVMSQGETPHLSEYRHGFEDIDIGDIQKAIKADGALFQINHPTSFPPPLFSNFCRGCYFQLGDAIDWDQVDTMEILNGPVLTTASDLGLPLSQPTIENPFMTTAIRLWEKELRAGHRITGVSGSDSKGVETTDAERQRAGWGSSATAVYARELSRAALTEGLQAGHVYVRTRGVDRSPALEFTATTADGQSGIFGDTLTVGDREPVTLTTVVTGGQGQVLSYIENGVPVRIVPITSDPFSSTITVTRQPGTEGPLGTFWRIETRDLTSRTTLGNPVFLKGP